jgi:hypothetical protein
MGAIIEPPRERVCQRCGRHDVWNENRGTWDIVTEDGEKRAGNPQCLHEWDINGSYNPVVES